MRLSIKLKQSRVLGKEMCESRESPIPRGGSCDRSEVFLSWWKRPWLHWQKLSAGKLSLCKCRLKLLRPPVRSFPPPRHPLLGWSSCLQAAWWGRSRNSSALKKRRGDYFWPGSVPWSHLPSRPAGGWTSPVEGAMAKQQRDAGEGQGLDHDSAWEKSSVFTDCKLNKEIQGLPLSQRCILCCAGSHKP